MKKIYSLILLLMLLCATGLREAEAQPGCPGINAGPDVNMPCSVSCTTLTATPVMSSFSTTSYGVSSIPYTPPYPFNTGTPILVNTDDLWSGTISLPFSFCFYGNTYNQIVAGSNGVISFNTSYAGGYCPWSFSSSIPNSSLITNAIFGVYHDIHPGVGGTMYYAILGSYPCRTFVVNWNNIPMYSCTSVYATHQIVIYESTNIIEVYVKNKPLCSSWNGGYGLIGIQNSAGSAGICPPGRNTSQWTASNEAWRFTPNGPSNITVTWWQGGTQIGTGNSISVCPTAASTTYTAQAVYNVCTGNTVTVTDNIVVNRTVGSVSVSPANSSVCPGSSVNLTASGASSYTWSPATGLNTTSGPNVTATPGSTTTYTVTGISPGCTTTASATVTVNPNPTVTASASPAAICSGQGSILNASGATSYSWSHGLGTGTPKTVNPTSTTTYTVTGTSASGCTGSGTVTVTVNPNPVVTANASPSAICTGQSTTLSASGAASYTWQPGNLSGSSVNVNPGSTTTYTVTGSSGAGCTGSATVTVTVNPSPAVTASASPSAICNGNCTSLSATGASSYSWTPGGLNGSPVSVCPTSTTTYVVTGTSSAGCTGTASVSVTVNNNPVVGASASPSAICLGQCTSLSGSGASTYTWNPGNLTGTTVSVCPTTGTTYTVTGSSGAGCTGSAMVSVTVYPNPSVTATALPSSICNGQSSSLTASGASTYTWQPGNLSGSTISVSPTTTTTYTVTGNSVNGCTATATVTVTVNANPVITGTASPSAICLGQCSNLTASGGVSYSWNPGSLSGTMVNVCPTATTTYVITGTDNNGCTSTGSVTVTVNSLPTVTATASPAVICLNQCSDLSGSGATTYTWTPGGMSGTNVNVCPTATTTYNVLGIDNNGCTGSASVTVTVNALPAVNLSATPLTICLNQCTDINATGSATYSWQPGNLSGPGVNVCPAATTTYSVTGTSGAGCSASNTITITVNPLPVVTASANPAVICNGECSNLSATGAVTYNWMPGSLSGSPVNVCPTANTTYTVTGTDINGCTSQASTTITVNPLPVVTASANPAAICIGQCTNISASGATNYTWQPGSLSGSPVNVCPTATTTYSVLGTDNNGCTGSATVVVTVNPLPVVNLTASPQAICTGQCSNLNATGAASFSWQPGNLSGSTVNVCPTTTTTYSVTGTSGAGCSASNTIMLTVNPTPVISVMPPNPAICAGQSVNLNVNSSVPLFSCNWTPPVGLNPLNSCNTTASPASTVTYNVTGTTAAGCTANTSVTVTVNPNPVVTLTASQNPICNGQCSQLGASSFPAAASWNWAPGTGLSSTTSPNPTACPTNTTTYNVIALTSAGCTGQGSITLNVNPNPIITIIPSPADICYGNSTILQVSGNPALSGCAWSPTSGLMPSSNCNPSASPAVTTTYTVTGQTAAGCTSTATVTVNVHPNPVLSVTPSATTICYGETAQLDAAATPAGAVTSWVWAPVNGAFPPNGSSYTTNPGTTTVYSVTGTTNWGCTGMATATVNVNPLPQLTFAALPQLCITSPAFPLTQASPQGGNYHGAGVSQNTFNPGVSGAGTHTITYVYTDPNTGCTDSITGQINILTGIPVSVNPATPYICPAGSVLLNASGATTYSWVPPNGLTSVNGSPVSASPQISTTYTVTGSNPDGCSGSATATVSIYNVPELTITPSPAEGCSPLLTTFSFSPQAPVADSTWNWDFGDPNATQNQSQEFNPQHVFGQQGSYTIQFSALTTDGCNISGQTMVNAYLKPIADFYMHPQVAYMDNPKIDFIDQSVGAISWSWDFGDPSTLTSNESTDVNPFHIYSDSGTYIVTLIVESNNNCSDTAKHEAIIYPEALVWIPNAFTPNDDGINDIFLPVLSGIDRDQYQLIIFDRWGKQVFSTKNPDEGWDGMVNGKVTPQGVYSYILYYREIKGRSLKTKGFVTVVH